MKTPKLTTAALMTCLCACSCSAGSVQSRQAPPPTPPPPARQSVAKTREQRAAVDPRKFALIVTSPGGEEAYTKKFTAQAMQLYEAVTARLGFDEKHVFLLTENVAVEPEEAPPPNTAKDTADEVRKAIAAIAAQATAPDSLVLIVLIGHGAFDNQQGKFNLAGPDLSAKDYAGLLSGLAARRVVFVNCASSSGEFVKPLSHEGHIVITATRSGNEQNLTMFPEHFIKALTDPAADADKNGRVSVLEAFNYATKLTADWYKEKDRLATEHALIEDDGDGVGHEEASAREGVLAKTTYLDSKPIQQAGGDEELAKLLVERQKFEESIEKLKARKSEMKEADYEAELERLLVELATLNQSIKAKQK